MKTWVCDVHMSRYRLSGKQLGSWAVGAIGMILPFEGVALPSVVVWSAGCTGVLTSVPRHQERRPGKECASPGARGGGGE